MENKYIKTIENLYENKHLISELDLVKKFENDESNYLFKIDDYFFLKKITILSILDIIFSSISAIHLHMLLYFFKKSNFKTITIKDLFSEIENYTTNIENGKYVYSCSSNNNF